MTFQREYFFFKVCTINILLLSQKINQFHFNCHPLVQLKDSLSKSLNDKIEFIINLSDIIAEFSCAWRMQCSTMGKKIWSSIHPRDCASGKVCTVYMYEPLLSAPLCQQM